MSRRILLLVALASAACGCNDAPGRPAMDSAVVAPDKVVDFAALYATSCAGCHGANGTGGAAIALADPVYLAVADDVTIRRVTAGGVPGTAMPAFARSAGGLLTDEQIDVLVRGMRARWAKPDVPRDAAARLRAASAPGDPARGADVYVRACASCHGADGRGGPHAASIVDAAYLALVSDRSLRTAILVGRPDMGVPHWRAEVPGTPLSPVDVADVVAWLSAQRPVRPVSSSASASHPIVVGGLQ
jgi:mono/diheme cytochrome c family protein